jgi:hypothetical protein
MNLVNEEEFNCKIVCSRGILKSCKIHSLKPISSIKQLIYYDFAKMVEGDTLYICTSAIPYLTKVINQINKPFILVSGDSDEECSINLFSMYGLRKEDEFNKFINNNLILHWFSQNCTILNHKKISPIPIGLDYHTLFENENHSWGEKSSPLEQENVIMQLNEKSLPFKNRIKMCYANFHFQLNTKYGYDRKNAINEISKDIIYYEYSPIPRKESWIRQSKMAFVISPHGNGLDCHRTWEALVLGCIPIVKTSPLDILFEDLPVLIVEEWRVVNEELLNETILLFSNKEFNYNKLTLKYWMSQINTIKNNIK